MAKIINKQQAIQDYLINNKINGKEILFLDIETTGLDPKEDEILQLSVVNADKEILFDKYFKPQNHTEWPNAEKITGITPGLVQNCPIFEQYREKITELLNPCKLIVGYGIHTDLKFLRTNKINIREKTFFDVAAAFTKYCGLSHTPKLYDCAKHFGYPLCYGSTYLNEPVGNYRGLNLQYDQGIPWQHDSLGDCMATHWCFICLITYC